MQWKMIRQVARGSASDPLVLLKAVSLFLLKTIHLKTLTEILITMLIYIVTTVYIICCHSFAFE